MQKNLPALQWCDYSGHDISRISIYLTGEYKYAPWLISETFRKLQKWLRDSFLQFIHPTEKIPEHPRCLSITISEIHPATQLRKHIWGHTMVKNYQRHREFTLPWFIHSGMIKLVLFHDFCSTCDKITRALYAGIETQSMRITIFLAFMIVKIKREPFS